MKQDVGRHNGMHGTMTHGHVKQSHPLDGKAIKGMQACMHTQLASGGHKGLGHVH